MALLNIISETRDYFREIFDGVASLVRGMKVTGGYFIRPKEIVTQRYPENRNELKMFDNFKGELELILSLAPTAQNIRNLASVLDRSEDAVKIVYEIAYQRKPFGTGVVGDKRAARRVKSDQCPGNWKDDPTRSPSRWAYQELPDIRL